MLIVWLEFQVSIINDRLDIISYVTDRCSAYSEFELIEIFDDDLIKFFIMQQPPSFIEIIYSGAITNDVLPPIASTIAIDFCISEHLSVTSLFIVQTPSL